MSINPAYLTKIQLELLLTKLLLTNNYQRIQTYTINLVISANIISGA